MSGNKRKTYLISNKTKERLSETHQEQEKGEQGEKTSPSPTLLTMPQVMRQLQLSRATLYRLIAREHFPVQRFGRAVRVDPLALQQWLAQRTKN